MRFDTSQHMKLGQQMKLAPRVIQSMEILQLSLPALEERIEQELESNVALEAVEPGAEAGDVEQAQRDERRDDTANERELTIDETGSNDFERLESMESSYSEAFDNEYSAASVTRSSEYEPRTYSASRHGGERDGKMDAMANTAARGASMHEVLLDQWRLAEAPDEVRRIGELLIAHIDDDGYIRTELEKIAELAALDGVEPEIENVEKTLKMLQWALEPSGIAARDTQECLLLQIDAIELESEEDDGALVQFVRKLIVEHLDDLAQNRLPKVVEETGEEMERIKEAMEWMHQLGVSPGRMLSDETPPVIVPDAAIEYDDEHDVYVPRILDSRLPALRISAAYSAMAKDKSVDKSARDFVRTNLTNAQWLIDAVGQRSHTLLRVLNVVAEAQRDFFDLGPQALKPLPMTQVADQLGVHVATVSRAVAGKHVQTLRGVMPLRRFFSGGTQTDSGEDMSWAAVKAALKEVVDGEDKSKPLSDESLAEGLRERGIDIARRTVAKYRGQLNIPPARMRREY